MIFPFVMLGALIALLSFESGAVWLSVGRLKRRVHVGGTRGKSSITRYIAAGLRECGTPSWGKITGVRPTLILANGSPEPVKRRGGARVQEQFRIIRRAVRQGIDGLVLECMSITPELQALESRVFRPHVFVLTRIRDDHREQLGEIEEQIEAMCSAIPRKSLVITDDVLHREAIVRTATKRGSRVEFVHDDGKLSDVTLPEGVFPTNVALALRACEELGLDSSTALAGILKEAVTRRNQMVSLDLEGRHVSFANGFTANDIESSQQFLDYWRARIPESSQLIVMLNTRTDRPLRSSLFASWLGRMENLTSIVLLGDHAAFTRYALRAAGVENHRIIVWRRRQIDDIRSSLRELGTGDLLIVGLGNIGGDGFRVVDALGASV